jgi:hypothetical protein
MARYIYSCVECGSAVKKEPLLAQRDCKKMEAGRSYKGLGGWRCLGKCRGRIKVKRSINRQKEE